MRPKSSRLKKTVKILVLFLVIAGAGVGGLTAWQLRARGDKKPRFTPQVARRGDVRVTVQATGAVQPENRLVIKPPINGRIDSLRIDEGQEVKKGQVLALMSSTDRAALLDAARAKGDAEVKHWEEIYRPTPIVAPMAGLLIARSVEPGQTIGTTDQVFVMSDHLAVIAQVDETDMAKVVLGQGAEISLDAYPAEKVAGKVKQIAFEAKTVSNVTMYDVQVTPTTVPAFMRSGMTASVSFVAAEHKGVVLLPVASVHQDNGHATVLVPAEKSGAEAAEQERAPDAGSTDSNHHAHRRDRDELPFFARFLPRSWRGDEGPPPREIPVTTGLTDGKVVEITAGIAEGDTVLEPLLQLPDAKASGGTNPFAPSGRAAEAAPPAAADLPDDRDRGVKKTYQMGDQTVRALDGVSLTIEPGEFVAIMGPSGSGKSTLMHILGLLDVPDEGSFKLFGEEVSGLSEDELAALRSRTIGFVFQQFNLLSRTTAEENVALPMLYARGFTDLPWAASILAQVGLGARAHHKPNELSGGQQQRVAIARALVNEPRIILADEPTGNLDSQSEKEILGILTRLNAQGITVVIVTHEPEIAKYVRRVVRMRDGVVQSDEAVVPQAIEGYREDATTPGASPVAVADHSRPSARQRTALSPLFATAAHLRQAFRALAANKARSALSMLGILIGVAAVIAMLALGTGARESIQAQLSSLGSNLLVLRTGGRRAAGVSLGAAAVARMTLEDAEDLRTGVATIRHLSPSAGGRGQIVYEDKNWSTQVQGTGPDYAVMRAATPILGRFFNDDENRQRARVAVLGMTVVRQLFGDKAPIGETIKINRVFFQVIGVLPVKGASGFGDQDDTIIVPVNTAMRRLFGKTNVDSIDIEVTDANAMAETQEAVLSLVKARHHVKESDDDAFQIRNMADIQEAMSETGRIMSLLLASIASISLLVGGIGIMNIMLVSVTERTREIGLRKAVGASRGSVQAQFLVEAIVVSALGGLIGIALGFGLALGLSAFAGWSARVTVESVVLAASFSAGIGVVFGYWPARKAAALHPIKALRHE